MHITHINIYTHTVSLSHTYENFIYTYIYAYTHKYTHTHTYIRTLSLSHTHTRIFTIASSSAFLVRSSSFSLRSLSFSCRRRLNYPIYRYIFGYQHITAPKHRVHRTAQPHSRTSPTAEQAASGSLPLIAHLILSLLARVVARCAARRQTTAILPQAFRLKFGHGRRWQGMLSSQPTRYLKITGTSTSYLQPTAPPLQLPLAPQSQGCAG